MEQSLWLSNCVHSLPDARCLEAPRKKKPERIWCLRPGASWRECHPARCAAGADSHKLKHAPAPAAAALRNALDGARRCRGCLSFFSARSCRFQVSYFQTFTIPSWLMFKNLIILRNQRAQLKNRFKYVIIENPIRNSKSGGRSENDIQEAEGRV